MRRVILVLVLAVACAGQESGRQAGTTETGGKDMISEAEARDRAEEFVAREWNQHAQAQAQPYTLALESVNLHGDVYQVQFRKVFREPTKASPPYRLVLVSRDGTVRWGNP